MNPAKKQRPPKPLTEAEQTARALADSRAIRGATPDVDKENRTVSGVFSAGYGDDGLSALEKGMDFHEFSAKYLLGSWDVQRPEPVGTARLADILNDDGRAKEATPDEARAMASELLGLYKLLVAGRAKVAAMLESGRRERDTADRKWRATQGLAHAYAIERMIGAVHALEALQPYLEKPKGGV